MTQRYVSRSYVIIHLIKKWCNFKCQSLLQGLGYGLDDRSSIPGRGKIFFLHIVQTGAGAYPMGTGGSIPGGKEVEAWGWPLTSILRTGWGELYLHSPICFHGVMFSYIVKYNDNFFVPLTLLISLFS
jgi:hypothetical protein